MARKGAEAPLKKKKKKKKKEEEEEEEEEEGEEEEEEAAMEKVHKTTETKQTAPLHVVHWWVCSEIKCVYSVVVISDHERRAGIFTIVSFLINCTLHYYYCCTITTFPFLSKHISLPLRLKLGITLLTSFYHLNLILIE